MIKLKEVLHIARDENTKDLVPVDDWPFKHEEFLTDMGFKGDGIFKYSLKKPDITVHLKRGNNTMQEDGVNKEPGRYVVEDKTRKEVRIFNKFDELEEYFANYPQKWDNGRNN